MIRTFIRLGIVVLALAGLQTHGLAQDPDLVGTYRCDGVSPGGNSYRSVVEIEKDGDTYLLRWLSREGPAVGIGIRRDDLLAVSYFTGKDMGVVVYRIEKGPRLTGQWSLLGADGRVYPETLTKVGLAAEHRDGEAGRGVTAARREHTSRLVNTLNVDRRAANQ
jgi:hypothetical protein